MDLGAKRLSRYRAPQHGAYTLEDTPDLSKPLQILSLPGVTVGLQRRFG